MFTLIGMALALGIVIGFASGGRLSNLKDVHLRWTPVLFVGLLIGMIPLFVDTAGALRTTLQIITNLGVLIWLAANLKSNTGGVRFGLGVIGFGWLLNFIAVAANGGMPLSLWAAKHAGLLNLDSPIPYGRSGFFKSVVTGPDTWFRPLTDAIPVRFVEQVVSVGDILLLIGIIIVVAAGMRAHHTAREPVASA